MLIALVGLPGGGKTTAGRMLARRLGRPFVDADAVIEERIGGPIREFFDQHGEAAFRDLEQQVIEQVARDFHGVLATGGGAVLRPANREVLRRHATVVYLDSSPEAIFRRIRHDTRRPLLAVADPLARLRSLHAERDPLYRETAHFRVVTGRPTVPALVTTILTQLELAGIVNPYDVPSVVDPITGPRPG